eukprot:2981150-Pyramimonas_sp.AAC.1
MPTSAFETHGPKHFQFLWPGWGWGITRRPSHSRGPKNCRGPLDGCNRQRRGLTDAEKLKRDMYEQAKLDAGQSLGYELTAKRANAAAVNISSTAGDGCPRTSSNSSEKSRNGGDKNKGRGKGKDMICRFFKETGRCTR